MEPKIKSGDIIKIVESKKYYVYSGFFQPNVTGIGGYEYLCYSYDKVIKKSWIPESDIELFLERDDDPSFCIGDFVSLRGFKDSEFKVVNIVKTAEEIVKIDIEYPTSTPNMFYNEKGYNLSAKMFECKS